MADEEIVILESDDTASKEAEQDSKISEELEELKKREEKRRKKILVSIITTLSLLLIALVIAVFIFKDKKPIKEKERSLDLSTVKHEKKEKRNSFSPSKLENMIQEANILYEKGDKQKALKIYEKISTFNEALSSYNIGVVRMKEKNYKEAINSFKKAILSGEQKCISSINAAISALHLGNKKLFVYYLNLAKAYLHEDINTPLYSYEMSLINYYQGFYYEALSTLKHPNSKFYKNKQIYMTSKILSHIGHNKEAINSLLRSNKPYNNLPLGLLNAKIGKYKVAKKYLEEAIKYTNSPVRAKMALALVENKLGNLTKSAKYISEALKQNRQKALSLYPIKANLDDSLFDVNLAQKNFEKELFSNKENRYGLIFYYAPYKIFNASQSVKYTRKGSMNIFLNKFSSALKYLKVSSTISRVNMSITKGIKEALSNHIFKANNTFKKLLKNYPGHAILQYNLALTYAQIGNYSQAYKHFSTSYHLDNTNYLAGIFAIYCSDLLKKSSSRLADDVKTSIGFDKDLPDINLYTSLIRLSENNKLAQSRWLETAKKSNPLNLIFDIIIAQKNSKKEKFKEKSKELQKLLPKDLVSNIIFFHMKNTGENIKEYAKNFQIRFKNNSLNLSSFYYGPSIAREQFTKLLQISGLLFYERDKLKAKIPFETYDRQALIYTLAYLDIYTNNFEESYVLYNKLIDDYKQKDSKTIFLSAVASIGAGHAANAIALLELSKLINPENMESRYALGLLYQEVKNFNGAITQYKRIGDKGFISKYFSFKIILK